MTIYTQTVIAGLLPRGAMIESVTVRPVSSKKASQLVVDNHYLHRRPPISYAFEMVGAEGKSIVTFGTPPSRHAQKSVSPSDPSLAIELNRLWLADELPRNTASRFVAAAMRQLPPLIVFSYADTTEGHFGFVYRALNFHYAGWTDMDRRMARYDYIPEVGGHTREAFRSGYKAKVRRRPKVKYWLPTGTRSQRAQLRKSSGWPILDWGVLPPPEEHRQASEVELELAAKAARERWPYVARRSA